MATAIKNPEVKEIIERVVSPANYTLTLSETEAQFVKCVMDRVSGHGPGRTASFDIGEALDHAGVDTGTLNEDLQFKIDINYRMFTLPNNNNESGRL
jgi:coproporphyrinogen III oxidase